MDESHLPLAEQSLEFRLEKRAQIRRANTERKSVQEGRPDRIADLLEEAARELRALRAWKREAIAVEDTWDVQAIGKLIDAPIGGFVRPAIQPAIEKLLAKAEALKPFAAVGRLLEGEDFPERMCVLRPSVCIPHQAHITITELRAAAAAEGAN